MIINTNDYVEYVRALVATLIKEWGGVTDIDMDDMNGEAMLALVQAQNDYEPDKGASFKTFLYSRVRDRVRDWRRSENRYLSRNRPSGLMMDVDGNLDDASDHEHPGFDAPYNR